MRTRRLGLPPKRPLKIMGTYAVCSSTSDSLLRMDIDVSWLLSATSRENVLDLDVNKLVVRHVLSSFLRLSLPPSFRAGVCLRQLTYCSEEYTFEAAGEDPSRRNAAHDRLLSHLRHSTSSDHARRRLLSSL